MIFIDLTPCSRVQLNEEKEKEMGGSEKKLKEVDVPKFSLDEGSRRKWKDHAPS